MCRIKRIRFKTINDPLYLDPLYRRGRSDTAKVPAWAAFLGAKAIYWLKEGYRSELIAVLDYPKSAGGSV